MLGGGIRAVEETAGRDDAACDAGGRVIEDDEVDPPPADLRLQRSSESDAGLETVAPRRMAASIEEDAEVDVALPVRPILHRAAEEVGDDDAAIGRERGERGGEPGEVSVELAHGAERSTARLGLHAP